MAGICTLEDLIEEIVGEIEDEFDVAEEQIEQIDDDTYRIDGMFPIDEFNERFGTELPDEDFHTVGGFVFGQLGRAPEPGDDVSWTASASTCSRWRATASSGSPSSSRSGLQHRRAFGTSLDSRPKTRSSSYLVLVRGST